MKLIKFYTQTCVPCKMLKPIIEKLLVNHPEVQYEEIDCTDEVPKEWAQTIRSVPTVIIIKANEPNIQIVGLHSYEYYDNLL